jgi:anthranilate phosphoribosyltransferase
VSSLSGSADVLASLGVKIDAEPSVVERCLAQCGICFIMAPKFHPAMRHVAPVRQELAMRTIFNLLGPLSNPAAPDYQLLGVYSDRWLEPMANVLKQLGTKAAWVVHGHDGLDELSLSGVSKVCELKHGGIRSFTVLPEDAGLPQASLEDIKGRDPLYNAKAMIEALSGVESAYRNAVLFNAAAGLIVAGKAQDLKEGVALAQQAIDSGQAHSKFKKLVDMSNERP